MSFNEFPERPLASSAHFLSIGLLTGSQSEGSTAAAIIESTQTTPPILQANVAAVIASRADAPVRELLEDMNDQYNLSTEFIHIGPNNYPDGARGKGTQTKAEAEAMDKVAKQRGIVMYVAVGYLRRFLAETPAINAHPGPIPLTAGMYGEALYETILEAELKFSEHILHEVTEEYDRGRVLARHRVVVRPDDTPEKLAARTKASQKAHLPSDINRILRAKRFDMTDYGP